MKSGFIYAADLWCEDCGIAICRRLLAEDKGPETTCAKCGHKGCDFKFDGDESTNGAIVVDCPACSEPCELDPYDYDTDDFPKAAIVGEESDSVQFCAGTETCSNGTVVGALPDGSPWKIGEWLENGLTAEGLRGLVESILDEYAAWLGHAGHSREVNPVVKLEAELYGIPWPEAPDACDGCDETEFGWDIDIDPDAQTVTYTCENPKCEHVQEIWKSE